MPLRSLPASPRPPSPGSPRRRPVPARARAPLGRPSGKLAGRPWGRWAAACLLCWAAGSAAAGTWRLQPEVGLEAVYTDNLGLSAGGGSEELIGELTPGLRLEGRGARQSTRLAYQAQGVAYASHDELNRVYHQLDAEASLEPVEDRLDLSLSARRYQRAVNLLGRVPLDNLNAVNRTSVTTYGAVPTLRLGTGRYATASLSYQWRRSRGAAGALADATQNGLSFQATQGRAFARTRWSLLAARQDLRQRGRGRFLSDSAQATVDRRLVGAWGLVLRGGYLRDRVPEQGATIHNGGYASAGLSWRPSPHVQAEATAGYRNRDAALSFVPTRRTALSARWSNRSVGLLSGTTLDASFSQRIRRLSLSLDYGRTAGNEQLLQLQGRQLFFLADQTGRPVLNPQTGLPVVLFQDLFSLSNQTFVQKQGRLTLQYRRARSDWTLAAFQSRRRLLGSGEGRRASGLTASVAWRAGARTTATLRASRNRRGEAAGEARYSTEELRLERRIRPRASAEAALLHYRRSGTGAAASYTENRLTVGLRLSF